jgi:hypothetical protein
MDQAASYVEAETQKPQNQKHNENRPKHLYLLGSFVELLILGSLTLICVSSRQLNSFERLPTLQTERLGS